MFILSPQLTSGDGVSARCCCDYVKDLLDNGIGKFLSRGREYSLGLRVGKVSLKETRDGEFRVYRASMRLL